MIRLGAKVKDKETGFEGIATGRAEYLYGDPRVMVEGLDDTKRPIEWWFEEERLYEL